MAWGAAKASDMLIGCVEDLLDPEADTILIFGDTRKIVTQFLLHSLLDRDQPSQSRLQSGHDSFVIGCAGTAHRSPPETLYQPDQYSARIGLVALD
jgi:hypothetical protein